MYLFNGRKLLTSKTFNKWLARRAGSAAAVAVAKCPNISEELCRSGVMADMCAVEPHCLQPKVVIIGAGIAGLSAADRLVRCGIEDVTVLEALDRTGGRIYTKDVDGSEVDVGANFIKGACTGNSVFTLACQEEALDWPVKRIHPNEVRAVCFDPSGNSISPSVFGASFRLMNDILKEARRMAGNDALQMDLWTYIGLRIKEAVKYFPETDRETAKKVMVGLTNEVRSSMGMELQEIPLWKFGFTKGIPGGNVQLKKGMKGILEPLIKRIKQERIQLKKIVNSIKWGNVKSSRALVYTCDGLSYPADYVVITIPLGFLKRHHKEMFDPILPLAKKEAIANIGLGYINKISLLYKKPFWTKGEGYIRTCWPEEEIVSGRHWTTSVGMIEELPNSDNALVMVASGEVAEKVEKITECQMINDVSSMIRRFLGDPSIPMPQRVVWTKWKRNPFFLGGVSYLGRDGFLSHIEELARPLASFDPTPVLLFAGEATDPGYHGTLTGARLSGLREAERIVQYTKRFCGPPPKPPRTCNF